MWRRGGRSRRIRLVRAHSLTSNRCMAGCIASGPLRPGVGEAVVAAGSASTAGDRERYAGRMRRRRRRLRRRQQRKRRRRSSSCAATWRRRRGAAGIWRPS